MLLDSGADVTLVPAEAVQILGAEAVPGMDYELEGFGDAIVRAKAVRLDLRFANLTFRGNFLSRAEMGHHWSQRTESPARSARRPKLELGPQIDVRGYVCLATRPPSTNAN